MLKKIFILFFLLVGLFVAAAGGYLYYLVAVNPGPELEESHIEQILGRESPVLYRDGRTKIGVFFHEAHRQYIPYSRIPKYFVDAIVAAEDHNFFHHLGIDIPAIIRAMIANFKAGRIVQGGSTLTQQTAENLFIPRARTYKAKLLELLYALRLEYHYSKEKILEFYANQFFVSGNGHGLGVAAHYYFNKEPEDLELIECAFIAGSVKRPNFYNPFTKKTSAAVERAKKRARERTDYVLGNMLRLSMISEGEYLDAINGEIAFRPGKTTYALNTVMDLVKDGLAAPKIVRALAEHGINNVSTSGVRIITSIEKEVQERAVTALRRQLSRLDVRLRGYDREQVQREYAELEYRGDKVARRGAFVFGRITDIAWLDKTTPRIRVVPDEDIPAGVIDRRGFDRLLDALVKYDKSRWTTPTDRDIGTLVGRLRKGDRVYVGIREFDEDGLPIFDLERFPLIEGAALVLQRGAIRAMVGGATNRFFNRAVDARRPLGSTFKPLLFTAALQLGWNSTDALLNRRNVFVFQNQAYFPRPDHHSPHYRVSMSWAGVHSENVAAVWLLYHLTDHLTPVQLREMAARLDMAPRRRQDGTESPASFRQRIRDRFGIIVNRRNLERAAFFAAIRNLEADFLFADRLDEYRRLKELQYGLDFDLFRREIEEELTRKDLKEKERQELKLRQRLLADNYLELRQSLPALAICRKNIERTVADSWRPFFGRRPLQAEGGCAGRFYRDGKGKLLFSVRNYRSADWYPLSSDDIVGELEAVDGFERQSFWDDILIDGRLSAFSLRLVREQIQRELARLSASPPYSMDVLISLPDFRVMLSLRYLMALAREMGVRSNLEPVLSFPLGANVISLMEGTRMYESMVTGRHYRYSDGDGDGDDGEEGLAIIERIEFPNGEVIYEQKSRPVRVVDDQTRYAVGHILQNVIRYGTGKYAAAHVRLHSREEQREKELADLDLMVPIMGKTGTANRYTNAAFLGFIPTLARDGDSRLSVESGYAVGVYVGFDDNREMKRNSNRISGAVGALPAWTDIANALYEFDAVGDRIDTIDLLFGGLTIERQSLDQLFVRVDPGSGGRPDREEVVLQTAGNHDAPTVLTFGEINAAKNFEPARWYRPFWKGEEGHR